MHGLARHRSTAVWLALVVATLVSWLLGAHHDFGGGTARTLATTGVLIVAFVKVRFVGLDFMELRAAPLALRMCFEAWIAVVLPVLVTLYLAGS